MYTLRGLGFTYYDLLDQAGRENCDPKDFACVGRNQQRANAVEDLWGSKYMTDPNTANLAAPKINVMVDSSQRATDAFLNNQGVEGAVQVGQTTYSYGGGGGTTPFYSAPVAPAPVPAATPKQPQTVPPPSGSQVVNSSGAQNAPVNLGFSLPSSVSGVPWWGWAIGAGALAFAFSGGGRR